MSKKTNRFEHSSRWKVGSEISQRTVSATKIRTPHPENETTESVYNERGQLEETKGNGTYRVKYEYNSCGEMITMRTYRTADSNGDPTQWTPDPATGVLTDKTDALGRVTHYTYDSAGRLETREWSRLNTENLKLKTSYTYNAFGDLLTTTYSDDTPDVTVIPDRLGRPYQITDASGTRTLSYHPVTGALDLVSYDGTGLLPATEVNYEWDTALRPVGYNVSGGGPSAVIGYDDEGRLKTVASAGFTHSHGYIPGTGTLSDLTTTEGSTTVLARTLYHDRMQRLRGIETKNGAGTVLSRHGYTLDGAGRRTKATRENGQRWDYGYDTFGQVTSAVKKFPDQAPIPGHTFSYQFDGIGNRTTATEGGTGTAVTYTPTALNQYSAITTEGGRFILGEAPAANAVLINGDLAARAGGLGFYWKQITGDNSSGPLWSNDTVASNGVTITGNTWTPKESVAPAHDLDGNLTYDGRWDYTWDAENRLASMTTAESAADAGVPRQRLDFVYDSQGRRVSKTVSHYSATQINGSNWVPDVSHRFLYDGWNLIAEYSVSGSTTSPALQATHAWGIDLSGTPHGAGGVGGLLCITLNSQQSTLNCFPAYDGNGNISAWIDSTGTLLGRMDYSPFGQLIAQYKFAGDAALSRLNFGFSTKYTDAETGLLYYILRYYSPATGRWPSRDPIEERGGVNLYGFVGNIPTSRIDLLGMIGFDSFRKTIDTICRGQEKKVQHWTVWNDRVRASYDSGSDKYLITKEYGILDIEHFLTGANVALKNENFTAKLYVYGGKYMNQDGIIKEYLGRFKRENEKPDIEDLPSDYAGFQFGELIGNGGTPELPIVAKNCTCAAYRSSVIDAVTKWQPLSDADHTRFMKKYTPVNLPNAINDIAARYEGGRTGWFIRIKLTGNNPDAFNKTVVPYKQVELKTAIEDLGAP